MAKIQMLRAVVNQRLSAAVEEVFVCFETSIREYEEELSRQRKLLDVLQPKLILHRADPLKISDREDSFPPEQLHSEQERSHSLDQEDPEPPQIKQQSQELWTNQEGEQLEGQEEGVNTKDSIFRITNVKSEFDPDQSQSSHLPLHPAPLPSISTEPDGGGCGAPEPTSDCQPPSSLNSSASHSEDSGDEWKESDGPQSGLKRPKSNTSGKRKREACSKNRESGQLTPLDCPDSDICKVCGKYFRKGFLSDVLKHSKDPECMWGVCGTCLHPTESFKKLLETHLTCSVCNMKFSSVFKLRVHMRNHTGEKSHTCTDCGKSFAHKCKLLEHMRVHTGEKPYKCSYCGKRFRQGSTLSQHMRTHTGEKPCKCSHCGKTFAQEGALSKHIRIHTGERPYSCQYCDVKCREKSILKVHMRCHTGEKPYTCTDCGKSYVHKRSLAFHVRSHSNEKPYNCSDCGKTFTRRISDGTCCIQRIHTGEKAYT